MAVFADSLFAPANNGSLLGYYSEIVRPSGERVRAKSVERTPAGVPAFTGSFFPEIRQFELGTGDFCRI